jgi:hypothetical protein
MIHCEILGLSIQIAVKPVVYHPPHAQNSWLQIRSSVLRNAPYYVILQYHHDHHHVLPPPSSIHGGLLKSSEVESHPCTLHIPTFRRCMQRTAASSRGNSSLVKWGPIPTPYLQTVHAKNGGLILVLALGG